MAVGAALVAAVTQVHLKRGHSAAAHGWKRGHVNRHRAITPESRSIQKILTHRSDLASAGFTPHTAFADMVCSAFPPFDRLVLCIWPGRGDDGLVAQSIPSAAPRHPNGFARFAAGA